ncbi:MAG TPA: HAD-IB family phosphatase [Vicinamibacterales bacterium]|jgi:2,3-diketo-5-methylthio-1-phosphopentane phosphatase
MREVTVPMVFLDFDGTVSRADVVDAILERHADQSWTKLEEAWRAGRIGSRECLRAQMALVRATPGEIDLLVAQVGLDTGFEALLETCAEHGAAVRIISDGFDYCIERILRGAPPRAQKLLTEVGVYASHLRPAHGDRWEVGFPHVEAVCDHGCATCKPAVMARLNPACAPSVFVGDGLSDRFAAGAADLVFAKDKLAAYCREQGLAYEPYATLSDVAARLTAAFRSDAVRAFAAKVRA